MSRPRRGDDLTPGQDSFLDIVSNLVGILIILVMVVGAQAKHALLDSKSKPPPRSTPVSEVKHARQAVVSLGSELERLKQQMVDRQLEVAFRKKERDILLAAVASAELSLRQLTEQLGEEDRKAVEAAADVAALRQQYEDLQKQIELLEQTPPPTKVIKHVPTPLAKTVFGREAHFRLKEDRIVHVPLEPLVDRFKEEARRKTWKLKQSPTYTDLVGPVDGFRLKYTLKRTTRSVQTPEGQAIQERVELDHFELIPVEDTLGEPLEVALQPQSAFAAALHRYPPDKTVVTVWVYPDSFDSFRRLKEAMAKEGYLVAGRPLPFDQYISGSPHGTRSAAQ